MERVNAEAVGKFYDQTSQFFEFMASANIHFGYWPEAQPHLSIKEAQEFLTGMMIQRAEMRPGQHLLDVGCGLGEPGLRLAKETGCKVTGITVSRVQVDSANKKAAELGLAQRAVFQLADAMQLPFADASFDAVWAFESMHHMPDLEQVLREMVRVAMPGGRVIIADVIRRSPMPPEVTTFMRQAMMMQSAVPISDYEKLLPTLGLELEEVRDISAHTLPMMPKFMETITAKKEELMRVMDETAFSQIQFGLDKSGKVFHDYLGYALIVARKPAAKK